MTHTHDKSSALRQGIVIFVYLTALTLLEFFIAVTFNAVSILVVVAVVKAALVMYYYMHIYKLNNDSSDDENSYEYKTDTNRLGLWLFLLSDSFVFGGLLVMRFNLLGMTRPHLDQTLGLIVTAVLLISSFFMNRAETAMEHGDRKGFSNNILVTFLLGAAFVIGVVAVEWPRAAAEGISASENTYGAAFFMMTGMHAFHVITGLVFLFVVWNNGRKGLYDKKSYPVEAAAVYWHFVDLVWIFFYPALYLIGRLVE
jgi:cytochrome c oxidase subunit 3